MKSLGFVELPDGMIKEENIQRMKESLESLRNKAAKAKGESQVIYKVESMKHSKKEWGKK